MPIVVGGIDTGYDSCTNGYTRRRAQVTCPTFLPRAGGGACDQPDGSAQGGTCHSDSDCAPDPYGHCELESPDGGIPASCTCVHGCRQDSDCNAGEVCSCADPIGQCLPATCTTGASCMAGCDCISGSMGSGCGTQYDCETPQDQCATNGDCVAQDAGVQCADFGGGGALHTCQPYNYCGVGRPFLVEGAARLAPTATRSDWRDPRLCPEVSGLSASARRRLADHWERVARMEHASIAAFARFTLQLLALGAPPDLVLDAQRATADETMHARMAFAVASAYGGRETGPGALAIEGSLDGGDVGAFLATLLREGCIGETRAAIEAREELEGTRDPVVRGILETIARDETRHAVLAWRTLAWLLSSGCVTAARVRAEIECALSDMRARDDVAAGIVRPLAEALAPAA